VSTTEDTGLAEALVQLSHLVQQVYADISRRHGLTPQQAQLLCVVARGGAVGMTELSRSLHLEKSSLTGLVDRIERRGLAARARDDQDRRACRIELTHEGIRLAERTHEEVTARLDKLTADLPEADRARLGAVLSELTRR
jgi:DNA-binding MarR family transcriptional regulator